MEPGKLRLKIPTRRRTKVPMRRQRVQAQMTQAKSVE